MRSQQVAINLATLVKTRNNRSKILNMVKILATLALLARLATKVAQLATVVISLAPLPTQVATGSKSWLTI